MPSGGGVYLRLGRCDAARPDLEKALKLGEKAPNPHGTMALYLWTCRKDKAAALKSLEKSFDLGFDDWDTLYEETEAGLFLKGLNDTREFKALIGKYRKE